MLIFIDTEFTDFIDCHLISLGMVTQHNDELYLEVSYPDEACSPFVREAVIPLLNHEPNHFYQKENLQSRILNWLKLIKKKEDDIEVCFDYQTDWDLFYDALDGEVPSYIIPRLVNSYISEVLLYEFWKNNPTLHKHHALHDARANAYAFSESQALLNELKNNSTNNP